MQGSTTRAVEIQWLTSATYDKIPAEVDLLRVKRGNKAATTAATANT